MNINDNAIKLSEEELKKVLSKHTICAASKNYDDPIDYCTDSAIEAEIYAGEFGWWCCNCNDAIVACYEDVEE